MIETEIEEIRLRYAHYHQVKPNTAVADIRKLLQALEEALKGEQR